MYVCMYIYKIECMKDIYICDTYDIHSSNKYKYLWNLIDTQNCGGWVVLEVLYEVKFRVLVSQLPKIG